MVATFFCSIAGGILFVLGISRMQLIAQQFIRLIGVIALALSAGVSVWCVRDGAFGAESLRIGAATFSSACCVGAAMVIMLAQASPAKLIVLRMAALTGGVCGIVASCSWALISTGTAKSWTMVVLHVLGQSLGALLIGSVTVAWVVGHAYLTATKMSIAPLQALSRLFSLSVGLRVAYLIGCLLLMKYTGLGIAGDDPFSRLAGSWLILSLRVGVGLIVLGLFAYMVADCVKIRSTQSATGILYFASVFAYIGELSSQHLAGEFGLPL